MACCSETSFKSYTFNHQWKINNLEARLQNPEKLNSPEFSSPPGRKPATKWKMSVFKEAKPQLVTVGSIPDSNQYLSMDVTFLPSSPPLRCFPPPSSPSPSLFFPQNKPPSTAVVSKNNNVWTTAELKPPKIVKGGSRQNVTLRLTKMPLTSTSIRVALPLPKEKEDSCIGTPQTFTLPKLLINPYAISFRHFLPLSEIRGSQSVTFECMIQVWLLDDPVHQKPLSIAPAFNLSKIMEEARKSNILTDVTIVAADGKEFKAHKVVLAAQSNFFKTRFESRWASLTRMKDSRGDRVEMSDVPANIMEAILSYVYTGKVRNIDEIALNMLSTAEEYGLEGLRKTCEASLAKTLTSDNVIEMLIFADSNNAVDLKEACIKYISSNVTSVRSTEGWSKLRDPDHYQRFGFEILDAVSGH